MRASCIKKICYGQNSKLMRMFLNYIHRVTLNAKIKMYSALVSSGLPLKGLHMISHNTVQTACSDHLGSKKFCLSTLGLCGGPTGPLTIILSNHEGQMNKMRLSYKSFGINLTSEKSKIRTLTGSWCQRFQLMLVVFKALLQHAAHSKQLSTQKEQQVHTLIFDAFFDGI